MESVYGEWEQPPLRERLDVPPPFIPPETAAVADDPSKYIVFVEGHEKVAAPLLAAGALSIGRDTWGAAAGSNGNSDAVVLIGKLAKFNFAKRTVYLCHSTLNNGAPNSRQAQIRLAFLLYPHGADVREALWRGGEAFSETLKDAVDFFETLDHSDIKLAREELHKTQLDSALFESLARKLARQFGIPKDELRQRNVDSAVRSAASEGGTPTNIPATAESWGEPVKANEVLDDICKTLARFVWMKPWQYKAVALWVALTYLHDATDILPLLLITSPEEECGKTTLLELVFDLSNRPIISSNISAAAIYRTIRDICPYADAR